MYAREEYDTKIIVAARVLTVELATILDPAAILKIGVETPKSNLSKLYTPKSCIRALTSVPDARTDGHDKINMSPPREGET
jgi:hypothetical protein